MFSRKYQNYFYKFKQLLIILKSADLKTNYICVITQEISEFPLTCPIKLYTRKRSSLSSVGEEVSITVLKSPELLADDASKCWADNSIFNRCFKSASSKQINIFYRMVDVFQYRELLVIKTLYRSIEVLQLWKIA